MLREKLQGFRFLFSDRGIMGISVGSFAIALFLESTPYFSIWLPPEALYLAAFLSAILFQYLFCFSIVFNTFYIFGAFRDNRKKRVNRRNMWIARALALALLGGSFLFLTTIGAWAVVTAFLVFCCFLLWSAISSYFFCKLAFEISDFTARRSLRVLIFLIIVISYGFYLVIMLNRSANVSLPVPGDTFLGLDTTLLDFILNLVLFLFTLATQGQRFMPRVGEIFLDFDHLSWRMQYRVRNTLLFIFVITIGFEIYIQMLNLIFGSSFNYLFGSVTYYGARLFFYLPIVVVFFFMALIKKPGKKKK